MNVYDFDKTIYDGDSSIHFYRYCLRRRPGIARLLPAQAAAGIGYLLGRYTKTQMKERLYRYFRLIPDMDAYVADFWAERRGGIKAWYQKQRRADDVIVSASPDFLLRPLCEAMGIGCLIASTVNKKTGAYQGENCHGEEKVRRFRAEFPDAVVEKFYSDSLSDTPLSLEAAERFFVKGSRVLPWPDKG